MKTIYILYCLSGFVSLGYQVAWFRIFVDRFGSTNLTFALVLCCFIGGIGAGALASRKVAAKFGALLKTDDELRVYGAVEILVALTVLLTVLTKYLPADLWGTFPYALDSGGVHARTLFYQLSQVGVAAACVFVPCIFMGVTFPVLCHACREDGRFPSTLYGWNTLGACSGVLACEALFLPWIGHDRTLYVMMLLNGAIGIFFLVRGRAGRPKSVRKKSAHRSDENSAAASRSHYPSLLLTCAVVSGFLCGAIEGDVFKRLWFLNCTSGAAMSLISFWAIVAIFLASWTVRALPRLRLLHIKIVMFVGGGCYLLAWRFSYPIRDWFTWKYVGPLMDSLSKHEQALVTARKFIYDYQGGLGDLLIQIAIFVFPVYFCLSLLLPYVCNQVQQARRRLGIAYGLNTLAFCVGLVGFTWLAPAVNLFYSLKLMMVVLAILLVALLLIREWRPIPPWKLALPVVGLGVAAVAVSADFDPMFFPPNSPAAVFPVRAMKSDGAHTTFVVAHPEGDMLFFDGHSMSGTAPAAQLYMRLMAHFPLLTHPNPRSALLVCFGVGNTGSAIATHDTIERIDVVELNHRVFETAPEFAGNNGRVYADPRVTLIHDDGRSFINRTDRTYDLVTSEPPPPMQEGVHRLYSREYYESVRSRLTPNGMMTQWLPTWLMPREAARLVVSTFVQVFPHSLLFVGADENFILLGSMAEIDLRHLERRFGYSPAVTADLERIHISEPAHLLARVVKSGRMLRQEYAAGLTISDQRHDLAFLFRDPTDPPVIDYDPVALLRGREFATLAGRDALGEVVRNLALLKTYVRDFPVSTLVHTRDAAAGVLFAKADWAQIDELNAAGDRALQKGRLAETASFYERSLSLAGDQLAVLAQLAEVQKQLRNYEGVAETLEHFTRLRPKDGPAVFSLGQAYFHIKRYAEAVACLERAAKLLPDKAQPHKVLGDTLAAIGRSDDAIKAYDRALEIDPDYADAKRRRARLLSRPRP